MKHTLRLFSVIGLLFAAMPLNAQNNRQVSRGGHDGTSSHGRSALVLNVNARVLEESIVIWNETQSKTTIPGRPVEIKLAGSNVVVALQFTPFIRRNGNVLVAQCQIWIQDPERGISYYTSIQTIPMEFSDPIHFFPLGANNALGSSIEIILTVNQTNPVEASPDNE